MIFLFVLTEFTNMTDTEGHTDRQTDRHTPHDDRCRACIASRGKNCSRRFDFPNSSITASYFSVMSGCTKRRASPFKCSQS